MRATLKHNVGAFVLIAGFAAHGLTVVANDAAAPAAVPLTLESSEAAFGMDAANGRILTAVSASDMSEQTPVLCSRRLPMWR